MPIDQNNLAGHYQALDNWNKIFFQSMGKK